MAPDSTINNQAGEEHVNDQSTDKPSTPGVQKIDDQKPKEQPKEQKPIIPKFTEAEPIDGYPALYAYFNRELKYPQELAKDSVEGTVTVSFIINENGKPAAIKIITSLGEVFDKESIRIIENMPAWKPATINGSATATRLSIPLTFQIKK